MKQKRKKALSPSQQKQLFRFLICIIILALLWVVFAPGSGIFFLQRQKKQLAALEAEQQRLIQENKDISEDIEHLQKDKSYLEQVAREEYGMLKKNEMVFDFNKDEKKKD